MIHFLAKFTNPGLSGKRTRGIFKGTKIYIFENKNTKLFSNFTPDATVRPSGPPVTVSTGIGHDSKQFNKMQLIFTVGVLVDLSLKPT